MLWVKFFKSVMKIEVVVVGLKRKIMLLIRIVVVFKV